MADIQGGKTGDAVLWAGNGKVSAVMIYKEEE